MNFLIKKVAFFSLLVITLFACEEPGEIGLDIKNPGQSFGVLYTDTVTVRSSTVLVDSVLTSRSGYLMAGHYSDPQLGTITANSFFQISPRDTLRLGEAPVLDSLVLFLHESYSYGGDTNQVQQLSVHLLEDSIRSTSYYTNTDAIQFRPDFVGYKNNILPTPQNQTDTVKINIDANVGNIFLSLNGKSPSEFSKAFNGLALIAGPSNTSVINFNQTFTSGTKLRLYYKNAASASQKIYDFAVNSNDVAFNQVTADKNNTPLANLQTAYAPIESSLTGEETFVQGGTGVMTKIDLSNILKLNENKIIRVNQAYLIVQPIQNKLSTFASLPSQLILYRANSLGNPIRSSNGIYTPTGGNCSVNPTLTYDSNNRYYRVDLTQYLQFILDNRESINTNLFLSVPSFSLNAYINTTFGCQDSPANFVSPLSSLETSVSKLVLGSQQHPLQPLKLQIYYTEIKQ